MRSEIYLDYARLASPPPAAFVSRLKKSLGEVNSYPDASYRAAKEAIALRYGVSPQNILLGNGADELIDSISRLEAGKVVIPTPTFGQYEIAARRCGRETSLVKCASGAVLDLSALSPHLSDARLVWICNPNNPSGHQTEKARVEQLADRTAAIVAVDEACAGFSEENTLVRESAHRKNMVVLRTFSKSYGLAGLRMGFAVSNSDLISRLERIRQPFNVNLLAQRAIPLALQLEPAFRARYAQVAERREKLASSLRALGYSVLPSETTFLTLDLGDAEAALRLFKHLGRSRIHVLPPGSEEFSEMPPSWLRITVGTPAENTAAVAAISRFRRA